MRAYWEPEKTYVDQSVFQRDLLAGRYDFRGCVFLEPINFDEIQYPAHRNKNDYQFDSQMLFLSIEVIKSVLVTNQNTSFLPDNVIRDIFSKDEEIMDLNLKNQPRRITHFRIKEIEKKPTFFKRTLYFTSVDAVNSFKDTYKKSKPLSNKPELMDIIEQSKQKIACLQIEYQSRTEDDLYEYHNKTFFFSSAFGFSAKEKLAAVEAIKKAFLPNGYLDAKSLPKAARQGELGRCVDAILKAQAARAASINKPS